MVEPPINGQDRLAELEALLPRMSAARERLALGDELRHVSEWLQQQASTLDGFVQSCAASASLAREAISTDRAAAIDALCEVAGFARTLAEAQDAPGLKAVREESKDALQAIKDFNAALRRAYAAIFAAKLQPLGATGDLIADLDPSSTLGSRLSAFALRASEVPKQPQFAAATRAVLSEAEALRTEIATLATEPEQMAFLDALVAGRATLRLLTPGVLAWLGRLGGLDRFVVRPQAQR